MNTKEIVERLQEFADPDGRIPFPIVDQDGKQIGVARRTPEEMTTSEAFVDEVGTAWTQPTAWAYFAVCRTREAQEATIARLREALVMFVAEASRARGRLEIIAGCNEDRRIAAALGATCDFARSALQPKDTDNG